MLLLSGVGDKAETGLAEARMVDEPLKGETVWRVTANVERYGERTGGSSGDTAPCQ